MRVTSETAQAVRSQSPGKNDEERINNLLSGSQESSVRDSKQVVLNRSVDPGTRVELAESPPTGGQIKQVTISFPPGAENLVDVKVSVEGEQLIPSQGVLSLDDETPVFDFQLGIESRDTISATIANRDATFEHEISVIVTIEEDR